MLAQPGGYLVGQLGQGGAQFRPPHQVPGEGEAVAHRLGPRHVPGGDHRAVLRPGGVVVEGVAPLAQDFPQCLPVEPGQVPDGAHPVARQYPGRRPAHE